MAKRALRRVRVKACAKINLTLGVGPVRHDGYHQVRTVLQAIDLHDTLTLTARPGPFTIACSEPRIPTDSRNLIWKAAYELSRAAGMTTVDGIEVRLDKRIPAEAGLGGGSADAAATLRALSVLWKLNLDGIALSSVARLVGADVPFFLVGGAAFGSGRGDDLFPLADIEPLHVVIVKPSFGVSTPAAYGWFDEDGGVQDAARSLAAWPEALLSVRNDLEPPVTRRHPQIAELVALLEQSGSSAAAMSGSGSAVFGLFQSNLHAARAAKAAASAGVTVLRAKTLDRAAFRRLTVAARA
ncbi:MAG: 4-(cytidine 5'-diphospho)-2-C-methyl-D-erythritol kinase [Acidobacteriota bacterium]|nr:4-(cytidine 5'-diphospho)-2-C-methyl-D-erythritol kinase [Acidobacteriota bacterium]